MSAKQKVKPEDEQWHLAIWAAKAHEAGDHADAYRFAYKRCYAARMANLPESELAEIRSISREAEGLVSKAEASKIRAEVNAEHGIYPEPIPQLNQYLGGGKQK